MLDFQRKNKWEKEFYHLIVLIFLAILAGFLIKGVIRVYPNYSKTSSVVEDLRQEKSEMTEKKQELAENITRLQTDTGIEEDIREKFNVAKEGEKVIVIVDEDGKVEDRRAKDVPFWVLWWQKFTSIF